MVESRQHGSAAAVTQPGEILTATATDASGNTSELSAVTPQLELVSLIEQVRGLGQAGTLSSKETKTLLATLQDARDSLAAGDTATAFKKLLKFQEDVAQLVKKGTLTPALGEELVSDAQAILDSLLA